MTRRRAICGGCKADVYLHRVDQHWQCPDCQWSTTSLRGHAPNFPQRRHDALKALEMYYRPMSLQQVADELGTCHSLIVKLIRRCGGQIREPGYNTRHLTPRTHCRNGHAMEGDNVYTRPGGVRACRACRRIYQRNWHHRQQEAACTSPE